MFSKKWGEETASKIVHFLIQSMWSEIFKGITYIPFELSEIKR